MSLFWASRCAVHSFSESHNNAFISVFCEGLKGKFCFENSRREITFWWDGAHDTILPVSNQFIFLSSLPLQIKCLNITIKSVVFAHPTKKNFAADIPAPTTEYIKLCKKKFFFNLTQCLDREITVNKLTGLCRTLWQLNWRALPRESKRQVKSDSMSLGIFLDPQKQYKLF